jgi:hypothetical protein
MKKVLLLITSLFIFNTANAFTIGGAFAQLINCKWGQYGYEYGYIGTYKVDKQIISMFFGNNYCPT